MDRLAWLSWLIGCGVDENQFLSLYLTSVCLSGAIGSLWLWVSVNLFSTSLMTETKVQLHDKMWLQNNGRYRYSVERKGSQWLSEWLKIARIATATFADNCQSGNQSYFPCLSCFSCLFYPSCLLFFFCLLSPMQSHVSHMTQLLLLGKFEYGGGPIFKVVLEC